MDKLQDPKRPGPAPLPVYEDRKNDRATLAKLQHIIDHVAHLLPAQGPITVFIHHNTLHAFEDLPFTEAVKKAADVFGCQPYLAEDRYRQKLRRGRIRVADLESVLLKDLGPRAQDRILRLCTRLELRLAMLQNPQQLAPTSELLWFVAETDALRKVRPEASAAVRWRLIAETRNWAMRDFIRAIHPNLHGRSAAPEKNGAASPGLQELFERYSTAAIETWDEKLWEEFTLHALWCVCLNGLAKVPDLAHPPPLPIRHRDLLLRTTGADSDLLVHEILIPFCGAFLDQGLARWQLPERNQGFFRAFCALYGQPGSPVASWRRRLAEELRRIQAEQMSPLASIHESLEILGVPEVGWESFLTATLLALRGWAGIARILEKRPDLAVNPVHPGTLVEFLAVRLLLERFSLDESARETLDFSGPLLHLRDDLWKRIGPAAIPSTEQRAFVIFQLAQVLGWTPETLHRLSDADWAQLVGEVEAFSRIERQRIFHLAFERRFRIRTLDAVALHNKKEGEKGRKGERENAASDSPSPYLPISPSSSISPSSFQVLFCIDEREESMRRHLEELAPDAATFGIAGFFFVPMYYRGAGDAHFMPLCPVAMRPQHWVAEKVDEALREKHRRRVSRRRVLGKATHQAHLGSRSFAVGAILSALLGVLATLPLIVRTLFPRLAARIRRKFGLMILAEEATTRLELERTEAIPGPRAGQLGFTLDEMVGIGERVLRDIGLTSGFSRLVLIFGHGSSSLNNPHESAYDCGACGGASGGPNARALAQILNDDRVRTRLAANGLSIPAETVFVGGKHNTCNEALTFYDLDRLPQTHRADFAAARGLVEQAGSRNAHERCRRFLSAPLAMSFDAAREHVEGRSEDLSQPRPELGHATNAIAFVGRRQRTRGLFLDRRAFLNSYDPTQDDAEATILTRVLLAALPVCAGISLEYYFSYVDNVVYGCGSKLPHNIAALVGVMEGASSDLRTGLPWQMVEIHEPVRVLFLIETTPETMLRIMERNPSINRMIANEWVQVATLDPDSPAIHVFRYGAFHPHEQEAEDLPKAATSADWYLGRREHLDFAEIVG